MGTSISETQENSREVASTDEIRGERIGFVLSQVI
jgi:hypothetical protein